MTTITFDTYEFIKELKEAGFSEQQANVIAKQQQQVVDILLKKAPFNYTNYDSKDLQLELAEIKTKLIYWLIKVGLLFSIVMSLMLYHL